MNWPRPAGLQEGCAYPANPRRCEAAGTVSPSRFSAASVFTRVGVLATAWRSSEQSRCPAPGGAEALCSVLPASRPKHAAHPGPPLPEGHSQRGCWVRSTASRCGAPLKVPFLTRAMQDSPHCLPPNRLHASGEGWQRPHKRTVWPSGRQAAARGPHAALWSLEF